jgi:hypothetical protein
MSELVNKLDEVMESVYESLQVLPITTRLEAYLELSRRCTEVVSTLLETDRTISEALSKDLNVCTLHNRVLDKDGIFDDCQATVDAITNNLTG